jgi:hypothetical protein
MAEKFQSAPDAGPLMTPEEQAEAAQATSTPDVSQMHQSAPDAGEVLTAEEANKLAQEQAAEVGGVYVAPTTATAAPAPAAEPAKSED